jgi:TolA-binding protein
MVREGRGDSTAEAPPPELVVPDAAVPAAPEPVTPSAAAREEHPERPRSKRRQAPRPSPGASRAELPEPPPPEPEPDRELSRFRAAHNLHFSGDRPREAIEAYTDYLREFPNGRFVPEARYNLALDQIKLGNDEAARAALMPFAAGKFGGYRQKEARELLQALDRKETGKR